MKENKTIKNISIVIISILILAIIGLGIYMIFIKKDGNVKEGNYTFTKLEKVELNENEDYSAILNKEKPDHVYIKGKRVVKRGELNIKK